MNNKLFKIIKFLILSSSVFMIFACEADEIVKEVTIVEVITETIAGDPGIPIEDQTKTSGFVLSSFASLSGSIVNFVNHFDDKPSGNIDLTQFQSFERYVTRADFKNAIFAQGTSNAGELNKITFDFQTGDLEDNQKLPLSGNLTSVTVINDELAVYTINNQTKLFLFNPTTFRFIRSIDMPNAVTFEGHDFNYSNAIYRSQDNKIFLPLDTDNQAPPFYDAKDIFVEVIDLNTMAWESTAILENAQLPQSRSFHESRFVDEDGNIFIPCQGSYSIDGQAGPTAAIGSRPQIVKIPVGSTDFDPDYRFNPVNTLGFQNLIAQVMTGFIYGANGIAYTTVSAVNDSAELLALVFKLTTGTITADENAELRNLAINGANSKWARLDLNTQTATIIEDIPFTSGFATAESYELDGKLILAVFNPDLGVNGYFEYDPVTNTSVNLFAISGGGTVGELSVLTE